MAESWREGTPYFIVILITIGENNTKIVLFIDMKYVGHRNYLSKNLKLSFIISHSIKNLHGGTRMGRIKVPTGYFIKRIKFVYITVFEIKGAPCVYDINAGCMILKAVHPACAPVPLIFSVYHTGSLCAIFLNFGCTHFQPSAPDVCTNLNFNFEHWYIFKYFIRKRYTKRKGGGVNRVSD